MKTYEQLLRQGEKIREQARKDLLALNAGKGLDHEINRLFAPRPLKSDLRPWPLCFAIFGLGIIGTFVYMVIDLMVR